MCACGAEFLGFSRKSKWRFQQILLQHAGGNFPRNRVSICCSILFCILCMANHHLYSSVQSPRLPFFWILILMFNASSMHVN